MKKSVSISFLSMTWVLLLAVTLLSSCEKTKVEYESNRPIIIKAVEGAVELNVIARDVEPAVDEFDLLTITRDVTTPDQLKASMTIKLALAPDLITTYNDSNHTTFVPLPASSYTLSDDLNAVTFAPGETIKKIRITLTKSGLDLSAQYALALNIAEVPTGSKLSVAKSALFSIGIKNSFDGIYSLNINTIGWAAYGIADDVPGDYGDIGLSTSGGNTVKLLNYVKGGSLQPAFAADLSTTQFGAASPEFTIDPVSYKVTKVRNVIPDDGRGRTFFINPAATAADNYYDPATGTLFANYIMTQTGRPNQTIKCVFTYVGPR